MANASFASNAAFASNLHSRDLQDRPEGRATASRGVEVSSPGLHDKEAPLGSFCPGGPSRVGTESGVDPEVLSGAWGSLYVSLANWAWAILSIP